VEDDYLYVDWLRDAIESNVGGKVEVITTELEFRNRFEELATRAPDIVLMDIMLRWTDPSPEMVPPPKGLGTFHRAGLRCLQLLRADKRTSQVPVILYSVLEESDIAQDMKELGLSARHVAKSIHPEALFGQIQSYLPNKA
jgi:CheY-like chemotaxis protein